VASGKRRWVAGAIFSIVTFMSHSSKAAAIRRTKPLV
jgi:hypothetical protein